MTTDAADTRRPASWGLAAKLFAVLALLGAIAVLVTGVLGYISARDALEEAIYDQLTAARQTKARQVESYFRDTRNDLRLLASTKMVVDAMRDFRAAYEELERKELPADLKSKVDAWYAANYLPDIRRQLGKDATLADYLPVGPAANYLQYRYIVANPYPAEQRKLLDDAGDGSDYSTLHAIYHPLMRAAADIDGLLRLHAGRRQVRPPGLRHGQGGGLRHLAADRPLPRLQRSPPPSPAARGTPDRIGHLPGGFRALCRRRAARPTAFMAAPVIDQGVVIGVLIAQLSIDGDRQGRDRRPPLAPGRLRRHRRGLPGRARLPGPLGRAPVLREPRRPTSPS